MVYQLFVHWGAFLVIHTYLGVKDDYPLHLITLKFIIFKLLGAHLAFNF